MFHSEDPEVKAIAQARGQALAAAGRAYQQADGWTSLAKAIRRARRPAARRARIREGDDEVQTKCGTCGDLQVDKVPQYSAKTGVYICRRRACHACKDREDTAKGTRAVRRHFKPVDGRECFSQAETIEADDKRHMTKHGLTDDMLGWTDSTDGSDGEDGDDDDDGEIVDGDADDWASLF